MIKKKRKTKETIKIKPQAKQIRQHWDSTIKSFNS